MADIRTKRSLFVRAMVLFVIVAGLTPPVTYYLMMRQHVIGNLESEVDMTARLITNIIIRNPELWELEKDRIEGVIQGRHRSSAKEDRRVVNSRGEVVVEDNDGVRGPSVTVAHPVMDSGVPVGTLEIVRSLSPHPMLSLLIAAVTVGGGALFLLFLQTGVFRRLAEAEGALEAYREKLQALTATLTTAEEENRRKLAAVLHDDIGQILALCRLKLLKASDGRDGPAEVRDAEGARKLLDEAISRTRALTSDMSSQTLQELGLAAAVEELARTFRKQHGLRVTVKKNGSFQGLPKAVRDLLFRALRELLTNVVKHAGAGASTIEMTVAGGTVTACVSDDGTGFFERGGDGTTQDTQGFGIFHIREQLARLGGELKIESFPGGGSRIIMKAPAGASPAGGGGAAVPDNLDTAGAMPK